MRLLECEQVWLYVPDHVDDVRVEVSDSEKETEGDVDVENDSDEEAVDNVNVCESVCNRDGETEDERESDLDIVKETEKVLFEKVRERE